MARRALGSWLSGALCASVMAEAAAEPTVPLPNLGPSVFRLLGAFALVLVLVFAVLWVLRHGPRFRYRGAVTRKLNVLEVRMLGNRQSLCVVGYERQRLLLAAGPTGVTLLTTLPAADEVPAAEPAPALMPNFAEALQHALGRKG